MTGCFFISPEFAVGHPEAGVFTGIYADAVATLKEPPPDAKPILPANFSSYPSAQPSSVRLVRKLEFIGPAAVAMAGDGFWIGHCLSALRAEMPTLLGVERPMRWLGDAANRTNAQQGEVVLEVIGVCPSPDGLTSNFMSYNEQRSYKQLGMTDAIGSGRDDLLAYCDRYDAAFEAENPPLSAPDKALVMGLTLAAERIADEMAGAYSNGWGGYVEMGFYLPEAKRWERAPSCVHLYAVAHTTSDGRWSARLFPRAVAYDPGHDVGRILSIHAENGVPVLREFLLISKLVKEVSQPSLSEFWSTYTPKAATLTLVTPAGGNDVHYTSTVLTQEQFAGLTFRPVGANWGYSLSPPAFNSVVGAMMAGTGKIYAPI